MRDLLYPADVAKKLGIPLKRLYVLNRQGDGPRYLQLTPRRRRYRPEDVEAYIESKRVPR